MITFEIRFVLLDPKPTSYFMHNRNIGAESGLLGQYVEFINYHKLEICKVSWGVQIIMQNMRP